MRYYNDWIYHISSTVSFIYCASSLLLPQHWTQQHHRCAVQAVNLTNSRNMLMLFLEVVSKRTCFSDFGDEYSVLADSLPFPCHGNVTISCSATDVFELERRHLNLSFITFSFILRFCQKRWYFDTPVLVWYAYRCEIYRRTAGPHIRCDASDHVTTDHCQRPFHTPTLRHWAYSAYSTGSTVSQ